LNQKRSVTLFSATIIVIANMIGAGVFTTLGLQVATIPSAFAALMLWVLGSVGAFCGALSYAELGAMMPRSGGEYAYLSTIYHPAVGFLSGWVSLVAGFAAPIALTAIALGEYVGALFPGIDKTVLAVLIIMVISLLHITDVKFSCHCQNFFTVGKVLLIVSFIVVGFLVPNPHSISLLPSGVDVQLIFSPEFAVSLVYVFYAFSGWNASAYVAGEIRRPERNLPLSLFLGVSFVSLCYILINGIFLYTVPISEMANKIDVGYLSAQTLFGGKGGMIMTLMICLALNSSLSSLIMVGPRVTQAMSEDLEIFRVLGRRNHKGAPVIAVLVQSAVAILLTVTSTFNSVLTYAGFSMALFSSLTVMGVFILRWQKPHLERPFKTWGYPYTPAIFLFLNGWMLCYLFVERPLPSLCGLITVAAGLLLYRLVAMPRPAEQKLALIPWYIIRNNRKP
jgi:APA family basic amino acid/polyamine antiporter